MKTIYKIIAGMYTTATLIVLIFVTGEKMNQTAMLLGAAGIALLCAAAGLKKERPSRKNGQRAEVCIWLAVFAFQATASYFAYFLIGLDASGMLTTAYDMATYHYAPFIDSHYFSTYPNNAFLAVLFSKIIEIFRAVAGDPGKDRCAYILIVVQCALNSLTGFLTRRMAFKLTGKRAFSWAVGLVYIGFISISPRVMVPYSDSMGLLIPLATLYLYQKDAEYGEERRKIGNWLAIGFVAAVGYLIKPQAVIPMIAITLIETVRLLSQKQIGAWFRHIGLALVMIFVVTGPVNTAFVDHSEIEIDPELNFGMTHYLMMGLNEETSGYYSQDDLYVSLNAKTRKERVEKHLQIAKERFENMWEGKRLGQHIKRKLTATYSSGTFGWWTDGGRIEAEVADKDDVISPFLKSLTRVDGERYDLFAGWLQRIWLGLLACSLLLPFAAKGERARTISAIALTLLGLMFFETLFETNARYLFTHAPLFLLAGMLSLEAVMERIMEKWKCG